MSLSMEKCFPLVEDGSGIIPITLVYGYQQMSLKSFGQKNIFDFFLPMRLMQSTRTSCSSISTTFPGNGLPSYLTRTNCPSRSTSVISVIILKIYNVSSVYFTRQIQMKYNIAIIIDICTNYMDLYSGLVYIPCCSSRRRSWSLVYVAG